MLTHDESSLGPPHLLHLVQVPSCLVCSGESCSPSPTGTRPTGPARPLPGPLPPASQAARTGFRDATPVVQSFSGETPYRYRISSESDPNGPLRPRPSVKKAVPPPQWRCRPSPSMPAPHRCLARTGGAGTCCIHNLQLFAQMGGHPLRLSFSPSRPIQTAAVAHSPSTNATHLWRQLCTYTTLTTPDASTLS